MEKPADDSLGGPGVLDKYTAAGKVARRAMEELLQKLLPGADVHELTRWGNTRIVELCREHFPSKKMEKGVAFPVCVSPNEIVGNFAPLKEESIVLKNGDLVKVELGVHFDGFPVILAHSACVGPVGTDEQRLLAAGYCAMLGAVKAIAANRESSRLTRIQGAVAKAFNASFLDSSSTMEIKRYLLHGNRAVPSHAAPGTKTDNFLFKPNEVYAVEALVSLAPEESKSKASELRTTVFRRSIEMSGDPKTSAGRQFLREVRERFSDLTFSLNAWEDELAARVGSTDCLNNRLIEPLPVCVEKSRAKVAHFRWTVGVSGKRLLLLAELPEASLEGSTPIELVDEELKTLFAASLESLTAKPAK